MRLSKAICICMIAVPCPVVGNTARGQSAGTVGPRRFGLVGGLSSSTFGGKDATDPTPERKGGALGGIMLVLPFTPSFAFQPELVYTMKGAVLTDPSGDATFKMNYIQLPLLLRYDMPVAGGGVKPFFLAGPAIGFRGSCNFDIKGSFAVNGTCDDLVGSGQKFETVDYSAILGGGLAFDVSGRMFTVGARYDYSFTKIQKGTDIKHRVLSLVTTFEFPMAR